LAYGACSLGFSPKKIRNIYATAKIYSTRSGQDDKNFPETLFDDKELSLIGEIGQEYGTTTGRRRKVNFLNLDRLIFALNTGGGTHIVISKCDVLEEANIFKIFYKNELIKFSSILEMKSFITARLSAECAELSRIYYSYSPETVEGLTI
jgi:adenylosuccinate synthase